MNNKQAKKLRSKASRLLKDSNGVEYDEIKYPRFYFNKNQHILDEDGKPTGEFKKVVYNNITYVLKKTCKRSMYHTLKRIHKETPHNKREFLWD